MTQTPFVQPAAIIPLPGILPIWTTPNVSVLYLADLDPLRLDYPVSPGPLGPCLLLPPISPGRIWPCWLGWLEDRQRRQGDSRTVCTIPFDVLRQWIEHHGYPHEFGRTLRIQWR